MPVNMISRDASNDPLIPEVYRNELIRELPEQSAAMAMCRTAPMTNKTVRQPVLSALPEAFWVSGDTGLKQTTAIDFKNAMITAEEIAVIVPVPESYLDDAELPIWSLVRPLITEAFGKTIDEAILFGVNKPATWTDPAIVPGAITAGNVVEQGAGAGILFPNDANAASDIGVDFAAMGSQLADDGYSLTGWLTRPAFQWKLIGARSAQGDLIYGPSVAQGQPSTIYGLPHRDVKNGSWSGEQIAIAGDWNKAIIGIRQDMTFKVFTEGVITDADGKVLLNLMQQDSVALRVVMRLGYCLPIPVSRVGGATRFPFSVMLPQAAAVAP